MSRSNIRNLVLPLMCALLPAKAYATNGMYMISHGARYAGIAGAATARGGSVMDLHTSPALLGSNAGTHLEMGLRVNHARFEYRDEFLASDPGLAYGNRLESSIIAPLPYAGFTTRLNDQLAMGAALFVAGAGGGSFQGITRITPGGVTANEFAGHALPAAGGERRIKESVFGRMAHVRLNGGLAYRLGAFRFGAVLGAAYGRMEMRMLYRDPSDSFTLPGRGLRYKSHPAYALTGGLGMAFDPGPNWRLAMSWSAPTVFQMDGEMSVNAGNPDYYHRNRVSMKMRWPEQFRLGLMRRFGDLTLSLDLGYINWSSHLSTITFRLDDSVIETPLGFSSNTLVMNLHTLDQAVFALGLEHALNETWKIRYGYNYARANVARDGVNPLFAIVTEHHFTAGLGMVAGNNTWDMALEYAPPNRVSGGNASNWDIGHAVLNPSDVRVAGFSHSKGMRALAFIFGLSRKLN